MPIRHCGAAQLPRAVNSAVAVKLPPVKKTHRPEDRKLNPGAARLTLGNLSRICSAV